MKRILAVDDNLLILKSLRRLFAHSSYEITIEENPLEALKYLETHEVDVVISDMRMPVMDGYQLLSEIKSKYPQIFRIVLSGYTDEKIVFEALRRNIAKIYIAKPWNDEELIRQIDAIFETEALLNSEIVRVTINNLEELPTIQSSYLKILKLIEIDADIADIAKAIEKDPTIAIKILHVANSAFFGLKTASIKHAAAFLGFKHLKNLVMSTGIIENFGGFAYNTLYLDMMWQHAFLTNSILQYIYEKWLNEKLDNDNSSAGLLHNIGIAVMYSVFKESYHRLLEGMQSGQFYILSEEQLRYEVNHQEVGGYLLRWWDLPFPIVESALYHHTPLDSRIINKKLLAAVHVAQHYAWKIVDDKINNTFYLDVFDTLKIDPSKFDTAISQIKWQ